MLQIGPALVLALVLATFHTGLYVFVRNRIQPHVLAVWPAAVVGALAGNALGQRIGGDPLRFGDFDPLWASLVAWAAIGFVALVSLLVPPRGR